MNCSTVTKAKRAQEPQPADRDGETERQTAYPGTCGPAHPLRAGIHGLSETQPELRGASGPEP
jgi:hypothetical protein